MTGHPTRPPEAVPCRTAALPHTSLEERVLELEKKLLWERIANQELKKKNSSLESQLRKFYP